MAEDSGTAAAESGENNGSGSQEIINAIPAEWSESDSYKDFFNEDGAFDFNKFSESFTANQTELSQLKNNQPEIPDKPEDYIFEFEDNSVPIDEADFGLQRELAKELGLTQDQYAEIVKFDLARVQRATEKFEQETNAARDKLVKDWGGRTKFETNMKAAAKVAIQVFGEGFAKRNDLGNDPELLKGLYLISTKLSEDTLKQGITGGVDQRPRDIDGQPMIMYDKSDMESNRHR